MQLLAETLCLCQVIAAPEPGCACVAVPMPVRPPVCLSERVQSPYVLFSFCLRLPAGNGSVVHTVVEATAEQGLKHTQL